METQTLFLAWRAHDPHHQWFPVGRLDLEKEPKQRYRFRYVRGAEQARARAGFSPPFEFPDLNQGYEFDRLFPIFQNRVMQPTRPDFPDYLRSLGLPEQAEPFEILSISGGRRATDSYEVFPKIKKTADGSFTCRFFLHGSRHVNQKAQERITKLQPGENLYVTLELTNPATGLAVQIQTEDYHMIGWSPRYLVADLTAAVANSCEHSAEVVLNNTGHSYVNQQVLVEMRGRWHDHEPMSGEEFQPLVS